MNGNHHAVTATNNDDDDDDDDKHKRVHVSAYAVHTRLDVIEYRRSSRVLLARVALVPLRPARARRLCVVATAATTTTTTAAAADRAGATAAVANNFGARAGTGPAARSGIL